MLQLASLGALVSGDFRMGAWLVRPSLNTISKNGTIVQVEPKMMEVLVCLASCPGESISKETIIKAVWPDTFVSDDALIRCVSELRRVFGDDARAPSVIQTIPKRGYRLMAPVLCEAATEMPQANVAGSHAENPRFIEAIPRKGHRVIAPVTSGNGTYYEGPIPEAPSFEATTSLRKRWIAISPWMQPGRRSWISPRALGLLIVFGFVLIATGVLVWKRVFRKPGSDTSAISSLAVLPLENLSGDASQDYFADGMTDELITSLGQLPSLRVISRTSVIQYKGSRKALPQIARELKVDAIVEGTALRAGSRVRITVQLIQAATDKHLWARSYEGDAQDLLGLQSQVANAIAEEIRLKFASQQRVTPRRPVNPEAYEPYLKGRYFWNRRDGGGLEKAVLYYQRAVQLDPGYAPAYAGLAQSYVLLAGSRAAIIENMAKGKAAAEHAVQLDPSLAEAHTALALVIFHEWNFAEAEREYKLAVALGPNYATAHHWYGDGFLVLMGRFEEANSEMKQAIALDPVSRIIATDWGQVLRFERRYEEAHDALSKVLELDPEFSQAYSERGLTLLHERKFAAAIADLEASKRVDNTPRRLALLGYAYGVAGERSRARAALRELQAFDDSFYVGPWAEAIVHIGLGEHDEAFRLLGEALQEHSADCIALKVDPIYDPLRSDPRFQDLLHRTGLPQ